MAIDPLPSDDDLLDEEAAAEVAVCSNDAAQMALRRRRSRIRENRPTRQVHARRAEALQARSNAQVYERCREYRCPPARLTGEKARYRPPAAPDRSLGPAPLQHFLEELAEEAGCGTTIEHLMRRYAGVDPSVVHALGDHKFPPRPLYTGEAVA